MRVTTIVLLAVTGSAAVALAQEARYQVFGSGMESCADWIANQSSEIAGRNWLVGFWSGMNLNSGNRGTVGKSTDGFGIVASVKKKCAENPSELMLSVAIRVYRDFEKNGK